jgi:hypothetical protein
MNAHGFYGRKGQTTPYASSASSASSDCNDTSQITRETIPDLVKAQQSNAVAIQGVMQRMDAIAKDIEDMKKQISPQCQASSASVKSSPSTRRIPSELSVSYEKLKLHVLNVQSLVLDITKVHIQWIVSRKAVQS